MNKKEAIDKIKNIGTLKINDTVSHQQFDMVDKNKVLDIISRINEPKKVVVPKFVAYWYEENKDDFESNLYKLFVDYYNCYLGIKMMTWFHDKHNKPIETLVKMKLFGYEVDKEKLYKVSLKRDGLGIGIQQQDGSFKEKFTKTELSEYSFNDLDVYEVKEVEE